MRIHGPALSVRVYRTLLLAYPASFRREYGDEMTRLFRDRLQEQHRCGGRLVSFWIHVLADVARSAPGEHMETLFHGRQPGAGRPGSVWMAFAGAAIALLAGVEALLRSLRSIPTGAQGPDLRPVSETFLFVVVGAMAPVALGVLLAVWIALTVQKRRLRHAHFPPNKRI